eukprot:TRINITY_DN6418_c0_g1_i1.p1 TRINITY_DN6418_c0_g1~~TRINITY_DN6418_c0_g1_i1.p1  ORF type:complete len:1121 (-),score=185.42 TRINITY_DN6418_c0_g1_i1:154-3516(-)
MRSFPHHGMQKIAAAAVVAMWLLPPAASTFDSEAVCDSTSGSLSRTLLQTAQRVKLQTVQVKQGAVPTQHSESQSHAELLQVNAMARSTFLPAPAKDGVTLVDVLFLNAIVVFLTIVGVVAACFWEQRAAPAAEQGSAAAALLQSSSSEVKFPSEAECLGRAPPSTRPSECLPDLLCKNASLYSTKTALVAWVNGQRTEVSYARFFLLTTNVAKQLFTAGVERGDRVLILLHRGVHQLVTIYACMAVGAVWVPVDPDVPNSWLEYVEDDSGAALIIEEQDANNSSRSKVRILKAPVDGSALATVKGEAIITDSTTKLPAMEKTDPAVIFYTSGSTGKPKGVLHNFAQLDNAAFGIAEDSNLTKDSIVLLRSPAVWSTFEWEAFPAIMIGATLVVAEPQGHKDPLYLAQTLEEESVNAIAITPKSLDLVLDAIEQQRYQLRNLSDVSSTGEQLPVALANRFVNMLPHVRLHNGYNPTESAACTWYTVPAAGLDTKKFLTNVPAGLPQPGVSVYIMDPDVKGSLEQMPEGQEGEILLGGLLSEGYWNRPELTKEKFVQSERFGRLYHTGDKGKWETGRLITMGRIDRQVKVRGIRVEPEEVEAIMSGVWSATRVRDSNNGGAGVACVATTGPSPQLVAFVAPEATQEELKLLENAVRAELPAYYCPTSFYTMQRLPALPNGKVDLKSLAARATELTEEDTVTARDSLGQAKAMLKSAVVEQEVIFHCYALFCLGTILSHWHLCGITNTEGCLKLPKGTPSWVALVIRSLTGDQTLSGFMLLFAYQDSRPVAGESLPRVRWGQKDFFFIYLFMGLGPMYCFVLNAANQAGVLGELTYHDGFEPFPLKLVILRWFLGIVIMARLYAWSIQSVEDFCRGEIQIPRPLKILMLAVVVMQLTPTPILDICQDPRQPEWLKIVVSNFFAAEGGGPFECALTSSIHAWFAVVYLMGFYYSQEVVAAARVVIKQNFNKPYWAVVALGLYNIISLTFAWFRFPQMRDATHFLDVHPQAGIHWLPFDWAVEFTLVGLIAFVASWLPFSSSWVARGLIGSYLTHVFVMLSPWWNDFLAKQHLPGILLLSCLVGLPFLYMCTIGPLAQMLMLFPANQMIKLFSKKTSKAQQPKF